MSKKKRARNLEISAESEMKDQFSLSVATPVLGASPDEGGSDVESDESGESTVTTEPETVIEPESTGESTVEEPAQESEVTPDAPKEGESTAEETTDIPQQQEPTETDLTETEDLEPSKITETQTTRSSNMAISMSKYVDINSQFPEGSVADRSFGGMVFTSSEMVADADPAIKAAYDSGERVGLSLDQIGKCFGVTTRDQQTGAIISAVPEYEFALGYYGYYSPAGTFASRLSFAKVLAKTIPAYATATAYAVGDYVTNEGAQYKCITAVTKEENTGWEDVSAKFEADSSKLTEAPVAALKRLLTKYDMFGSFTFLDGTGENARVFSQAELKDVSAIVTASNAEGGLSQRLLFVVNEVRGDKNATDIVANKQELNAAKGTAYICGAHAWSAYMPMAIFAAVDFESGTVTQHMFRQFPNETPAVQGDDDYETFKIGGVNFYGRTQCNGTTFDFYQRGVNTDGVDTGVYCNEIWFKAACAKNLLQYLVGQERIPANDAGVEMVRVHVLDVCHTAQVNGAFMPKNVSPSDTENIRNVISRIGGNAQDVTNITTDISIQGYSVVATLGTKDGDYMVHYWVFYGTGDGIKFIQGDDVMLK